MTVGRRERRRDAAPVVGTKHLVKPVTRSATLVDQAVGAIRGLILEGTLRPGERLVEEALAGQLGISRPSLREALRSLVGEGLLHSERGRGVTVPDLTARDIGELYALRWGLERLAIQMSPSLTEGTSLHDLEEALERISDRASAGDGAGVALANWAFHLAICSLAQNSRLVRAYERLMGELQVAMAANLRLRRRREGTMFESVGRHAELLDYIRAGDKASLLLALDRHGDLALAAPRRYHRASE